MISSFRKIQDVLTDRKIIVNDVIKEIKQNIIDGVWIENVFMDDLILPHDVERDLSSVARQKRIS